MYCQQGEHGISGKEGLEPGVDNFEHSRSTWSSDFEQHVPYLLNRKAAEDAFE